MKKWYIGIREEDGRGIFFVRLTEEEFKTVCEFLEHQNDGPDEGFSGVMDIWKEDSFDTLEDAVVFAQRTFSMIVPNKEWEIDILVKD